MKRKLKMGEKIKMSLPLTVKNVDKENHTLTMVASTQTEDRHGDTIIQSGWDLKNFLKNPVILNSHNYNDATEVIAKATRTEIVGKGKRSKLEQDWKFAVEENPKAKIIFDLYAGGFLHASSVGLIVKKFQEDAKGNTDWFTIEEAELLEVSAVSVPANQSALAKAKGIEVDMLNQKNEDDDEVSEGDEVQKDDGEATPGEGDSGDSEPGASDDGGAPDAGDTEGGDDGEEESEEIAEPEEKITPSYNSKVINAIKSIESWEKKTLKKTLNIIQTMLDEDESGKMIEKKLRDKIRKRKVNQIVRNLLKIR
jgi:HK97 family phage prohead protease